MTETPREATEIHTRIQKFTLQVEDCRSYWAHTDGSEPVAAHQVFEGYWFGTRSLPYVSRILGDMRARFDSFPPALQILHRWSDMAPETRRVICHWHLQLADPLYRRFTGEYLVRRRYSARPEVTRDLAIRWVGQEGPGRWTMPTQLKISSKLLSAAYSAKLLSSNRDPRPVVVPRVPEEALEYFLYLLRDVCFEGTILSNPYLASVGLEGSILEDRLRRLRSLEFDRQGDLIQFGWQYADLDAWATARLPRKAQRLQVGSEA